MAIKKNKTGIMAAISAATASSMPQIGSKDRAQPSLPRGTIGSVRASLGGIQDIDTGLILPWGPSDRMDPELTAVNNGNISESMVDLTRSISETGQQVPVLLRPASDTDGHFEVIYGRRRISACRKLGIPVKALIRTLDDTDALMAKGLENASRTDLSFYERARFAAAILEQGYDRSTACKALSISKNSFSQLERITRLIPDSVGNAIGPAPDAGRPKWMSLAGLFEKGQLNEAKSLAILDDCLAEMTSDDRLAYIIRKASELDQKPTNQSPNLYFGDVGKVNFSANVIKINLSKEHSNEFKKFFEKEMTEILERYKKRIKAR